MKTYFRLHPDDEDPGDLLLEENQFSEPWGGANPGPCDKCGQTGRVTYHCSSCAAQADPRCEVCRGEVEFEGQCPTCRGTGQIIDCKRRGVSVFSDPDGLYRYMLRRDSDMDDSVLVELAGEESDDPDFDADEGALLVFPDRIVAVSDVDRDRVDRLRGQVDSKA